MSDLLRFVDVGCVRGGRLLFERLSLNVGEGEGVHVVGPNGSGKSRLIRLAAGLLRPSSGSIEAGRAALADDKLALDPELPLRGALKFWTERSFDEALEAVGLGPVAGIPVRHLSAGQRKRASLARVLALDAPLWLLDEPLNGLDRESARKVEGLIEQHRASGGAVVAASHLPLAGDWRKLELAA